MQFYYFFLTVTIDIFLDYTYIHKHLLHSAYITRMLAAFLHLIAFLMVLIKFLVGMTIPVLFTQDIILPFLYVR
jgi:hypothetical protein